MKEVPVSQVKIINGFWGEQLRINAEVAIYHQWEQLEKTGCIENFRLVADNKKGFREGYFFADSDAFKWLDAAARVYVLEPSERLKTLMDNFVALIGRAQTEDGYIYTYNQLLFPKVRWINLQIEHELYCHGHLIEAGVSYFEATGERTLLEIATKAADLLVTVFAGTGPENTPGHEEIEIALIRLFRLKQNRSYLNLAEQFIEQRGRIKGFQSHIWQQNKCVEERGLFVNQQKAIYYDRYPDRTARFQMPEDNATIRPVGGSLRQIISRATGKYFQQHKPVREQTIPVGHSVRFTYLEAAMAMLYQHTRDDLILNTLEKAWDHMVARRMYISGGIGSLPNIEGFGRDYELDPQYSYSETCAALGNMLWNWEMTCITGAAKYADLFEWQLYNAAAVGLGKDGSSYLYNNPLACGGGLKRAEWFKCPCCPSNISRIWAVLGKYSYSFNEDEVWVHQYIGSELLGDQGKGIRMVSGLPWDGKVKIVLSPEKAAEFTLHFRIPSWISGFSLQVNGETQEFESPPLAGYALTASGYDPRESWYLPVKRTWIPGDMLEIDFEMALNIRAPHHKVKSTLGQVAVSYGPLVYCLESVDNPDVNIFAAKLEPDSLHAVTDHDLFGGITLIRGHTTAKEPLTFLPYYLWANRGESQMTVYVQT
ncbi:glycoside hydrolase family 127 protein [Chloroflexota bacterium]